MRIVDKVRILNEKGEEIEIPIYEEFSVDFQEYYAVGARGGIRSVGEFSLTFYVEDIEQMDERDPTDVAIIRKNLFKLRMSLPVAKQVGLFLLKHIEEFEKQTGTEVYIGEPKETTKKNT